MNVLAASCVTAFFTKLQLPQKILNENLVQLDLRTFIQEEPLSEGDDHAGLKPLQPLRI